MTMGTLDAFEGSGSGTEYPYPLGSKRIEKLADLARDAGSAACVEVADHDSCQRRERRIEHRFPIARFPRVEILEALRASQLKRVVVGEITLNQNLAWTIAAAGSPGNLREQLKRSFGGTEVRQRKRRIGAD